MIYQGSHGKLGGNKNGEPGDKPQPGSAESKSADDDQSQNPRRIGIPKGSSASSKIPSSLAQHDQSDKDPSTEISDEDTFKSTQSFVEQAHKMGLERRSYTTDSGNGSQPVNIHNPKSLRN